MILSGDSLYGVVFFLKIYSLVDVFWLDFWPGGVFQEDFFELVCFGGILTLTDLNKYIIG